MKHFFAYMVRLLLGDNGISLFLSTMTIASLSGLLVLTGGYNKPGNERELIFLAAVLVSTMSILMIRYLSGSSKTDSADSLLQRMVYELSRKVKELQLQRDVLKDENRSKIVSEISERLKQEASESLIDELKRQANENEHYLKLTEARKTTLHRIYAEIDALGRRGAINLVLGVITALFGVGALSFFVLNDVHSHETLTEFTIAFLPRLSIVIIIEVFSYFFLRLYKSSLSEIKYFQNEATNIEFNFIALETSLHLASQDLIQKSLNKFIQIERNPILKIDQTTRELEHEALLDKNIKLTPDHLTEIIRALSTRSAEKTGEKNE